MRLIHRLSASPIALCVLPCHPTTSSHSFLQLTADLEDQLSSESLASHLTTKALHIQLKGLNGLINSGLFGPNPEQPGHQHHPPKLSLYIKYGRIHLEKQLPPPTAPRSHVPE